jgi:hypothetical protein
MELTTQERQAILERVAAVMPPEHTATFANLDRPEYGSITVDLDLLRAQIDWLAGLDLHNKRRSTQECRDGILNLLEGIQDLTDPPEEVQDEQ